MHDELGGIYGRQILVSFRNLFEGQKKSHGKLRFGQQIPDLRSEPDTIRMQVYNVAATRNSLRYYRLIMNRYCVNFPS